MVLARLRAGLAAFALVLCASTAFAQEAPTLTGSANGLTLTLNWTAVPGATGYDIIASLNGTPLGVLPTGNNNTSLTVPVPAGVYAISVRGTAGAITGPVSNVLTLTAALTPPAAPTELTAAVSGNNALLSWNVNTTGLTAIGVQAGTQPGASDIGTFAIAPSTYLPLNGLTGTYFVRVFAAGQGGLSGMSNEVQLTAPGCVAPATIPFTATASGTYLKVSWAPVPGATGYRLDAANTPGGGANLTSVPLPATTTSFNFFGAPLGPLYLTLHTTMNCGPAVSSAEAVLTITPPVRPPAVSEAAARAMVVEATNAIAAQFPGDLRNSCGNNTYMFRVLQRLRQQNNRFGLNYKRGNQGLSQDVITYIFDDAPEELADQHHIWMWDIIGGHCGPNPTPNAGPNWSFNIPERWTVLEYHNAGFTP